MSQTFQRVQVMGVLNVTPDSFSDGGKYFSVDKAVEAGLRMVKEGADILDIGGESTRPGSEDVSFEEELERVLPVIVTLKKVTAVPISVDTYKARVAEEVLKLGVEMINDVTAMRGDHEMISVLAKFSNKVLIMFSKDSTPRTTDRVCHYDDVIATLLGFLGERIDVGVARGIERERFLVDPGMGAFVSSDPKYSLEILRRLEEFKALGLPIVIGASRKGFIGKVLDVPVDERLEGSLACAAWAVAHGAQIIRTHDVQATRRMVDMTQALLGS